MRYPSCMRPRRRCCNFRRSSYTLTRRVARGLRRSRSGNSPCPPLPPLGPVAPRSTGRRSTPDRAPASSMPENTVARSHRAKSTTGRRARPGIRERACSKPSAKRRALPPPGRATPAGRASPRTTSRNLPNRRAAKSPPPRAPRLRRRTRRSRCCPELRIVSHSYTFRIAAYVRIVRTAFGYRVVIRRASPSTRIPSRRRCRRRRDRRARRRAGRSSAVGSRSSFWLGAEGAGLSSAEPAPWRSAVTKVCAGAAACSSRWLDLEQGKHERRVFPTSARIFCEIVRLPGRRRDELVLARIDGHGLPHLRRPTSTPSRWISRPFTRFASGTSMRSFGSWTRAEPRA